MIITIDTGGTKTLIASYDESGNIVGEPYKFPTPPVEADYVEAVKNYLQQTFGGQQIDAVAIAIPGVITDGVAVWCSNLGWKDFDVASAFQGVLGDAPILVENDANLAGLAETRQLGIEPAPDNSLYVTVSTGIGSGIITDGHINKALSHSEAGHCLVEYNGAVQEWESFGSGKAIYNTYGKYARDITDERTWREIADRISRGFLAVIPILQPDVIIIGGSIGTYFERYGTILEGILREKLPSHIPTPKIVQAQHPEQAVIYGCYYYAIDSLSDQ